MISAGSGVAGYAVGNSSDEWDDIAAAIRNHTITDNTMSIEVVYGEDGEPDVDICDKKE